MSDEKKVEELQSQEQVLDSTEMEMAEEAEQTPLSSQVPSQVSSTAPTKPWTAGPRSDPQKPGFKFPAIIETISRFISDAKRIFHVSRKPDRKEYTGMLKITALGIVVIGVIGFIITFIFVALNLGR